MENCDLIEQKDGSYHINPKISVKLADFGAAEVFNNNDFECNKQGLSLDNETQLAPEILMNEPFDAIKADIWCFGMILFECMTGKQLYGISKDKQSDPYLLTLSNGMYCLNTIFIAQYLKQHNLHFNEQILSLLRHVLDLNASERFDSNDIIKHKWFSSYYKRYHKQINKKSISQSKALLKQKDRNFK